MELYIRDDYGNYVPFDLELYEQEIQNETAKRIRKKNKLRNERKKQTRQRRIIGLLIMIFTVLVCRMFVAVGESDVTFVAIILPIAFTLLFGK